MVYSKIPLYKINVVFLKNSSELISSNTTYIPIAINKTQTGSGYLYIGKKLIIQINNKILEGTYQQKVSDNTEYLLINSIADLDTVVFNFNDVGVYNEIEIINSENDLLTITDIQKKLVGSKNNAGYKGKSGLMTPLHYEAVDNIPFDNNINNKSLAELSTNTVLFYYEKGLNENFSVTFQIRHSLFNLEYSVRTHGNNFQIKQNRFSSSLEINNLFVELTVNKINNNLNTKTIYQFAVKLLNIPQGIISNVERALININVPTTEMGNFTPNLPANYILSNLQILISPKSFNRNILFYDINGFVSVKDFEEIQLTGLMNINNIWNQGLYYYDNYNVNDVILNNLPPNIKNVFYLQVKRLTNELTIQYLFVLDLSKNEIKQFSRYRNTSTSVITVWVEYVTSSHKHPATDIITDSTHQFVTDEERNKWNNISASQFWKDAVMSKNDLPPATTNGETRLVLSEDKIYRFNAISNSWIVLNNVKIFRELLSDKVNIRVNEGLQDQLIELPLVNSNNPGIVPVDFYNEDYQNYFEQQLSFTINNAGTEVPGAYTKPLIKNFNLIDGTDPNKKIYDGITNYLVGDGVNLNTFDFRNGFDLIILKTIYTVTNNDNIFTGIIKEYNFILKTNGNSCKILFPTGYTGEVYFGGSITPINGNEINLDAVSTYCFSITISSKKILIIREAF